MKRFRNGKNDDIFSGSAFDRISRMMAGESGGELASHTGHGFTSYTFMTEDRSKNGRQNFTSPGTRHVFQMTREGGHWNLTRSSGDIRGGILPGSQEMHPNDGNSISFKTLAEARQKAKFLPKQAVSNIKSVLGDYKKYAGKRGSSGRSSG